MLGNDVCRGRMLVVTETLAKTFGIDILGQRDPLMFLNNNVNERYRSYTSGHWGQDWEESPRKVNIKISA